MMKQKICFVGGVPGGKKSRSIRDARRAFTLIELLVVIAIIGILAGVVLVNLNAARSRSP